MLGPIACTPSRSYNLLVVLHDLSDLAPVRLLILEPLTKVFLWRGALLNLAILSLFFLLGILCGLYLHLRGAIKCELLNVVGRVFFDVTDGVIGGFLMGDLLEEEFHVLLLELSFLGLQTLVQPIGVLDRGDRVHALLECSWDRHNLHDGACDTLSIVVPVNELAHVELLEGWLLKPLAQVFLHHSLVSFKDGRGNGSVGNFCFYWEFGHQEFHI